MSVVEASVMSKREMASLWKRADAAGKRAAEAVKPRPMVVYEADGFSDRPKPGGRAWFESEGVCGFAWINVSPGNSRFANWLKAQGLARKGYEPGVVIWVGAYQQSMQRKEAYAQAAAEVLQAAGVRAYAHSRMD